LPYTATFAAGGQYALMYVVNASASKPGASVTVFEIYLLTARPFFVF